MNENQNSQTGFVFISGAGLDGWIWDEVQNKLSYPSIAVNFPQQREERKDLLLHDYTSIAAEQIEQAHFSSLILVCHSSAGVIGVNLADRFRSRLKGMISVSAVIPLTNSSWVQSFPAPQRWVISNIIRFLGTLPPKTVITKQLCNDLSSEQKEKVISRFKQESKRLYTDRCIGMIPDVKKLYVRTIKDLSLSPHDQDIMAKNMGCSNIMDIETGHMPMLKDPSTLAGILDLFMKENN